MTQTDRDISCSWTGRIIIVKMSILPKVIYRFNAIPINLPMTFFTELEKKMSQLAWKHKRFWIAKATLERKIEPEGSTFLTLDCTQSYIHQDTIAKAQKQKCRPMRKDRKPRDKPIIHLWTPYPDKGGRNIQCRKDILFNKLWWENWIYA